MSSSAPAGGDPRAQATGADGLPAVAPAPESTTRADPRRHHLVVMVAQGQEQQIVASRILDLETDYRPLVKQLGYRAVARWPELAGQPFELDVRLEAAETARPRLRLAAWHKADRRPLAAMDVPAGNFAWFACQMADRLQLKANGTSDYSVHVAVLESDHRWVQQTDKPADEDFQLMEQRAELTLPTGFSTEPLGPRHVIRDVGSTTRCIFTPGAWSMFLNAAAKETEQERGWAAAGRVHLADGQCCVLVQEPLMELPAAATRHSLLTHGTDLFLCHSRLAGRLAAYLHLHPRSVDEKRLGPYPSGPDCTVAWNLDASTDLPVVLPIAMFGARAESPNEVPPDVAAHAFVGGLLAEVTLEVLADDHS